MAGALLLLAAGCADPAPERELRGGPVPERTISESSAATESGGETPEMASATDSTGTSPAGETSSSGDTSSSGGEDAPRRAGAPRDVAVADTMASGLQTPWDVDFLPGGAALVSLRDSGHVIRIEGDQQVQLDAGGPDGAVPDVTHESEDGLLGLAVGPDEGIYLYLTTEADNRVVRYDLEGDDLVNPQVILDGIPAHQTHDGGRLAFGPDGHLYVTTGDAREPERAQDIDSLAGKILRVTEDGQPAPGNPFGNEVWSYGHRNVQGVGWTTDGRMYASEFGSSEFDELNLIEPGGNYGWPHIEGWAGDPEYVDPLVTWTPDEASPSGIDVTDEGVWMTALRGERLWFVPLDAGGDVGEPREYSLGLGRLRAVATAPDGSLWVVTSNTDGRGDPSAEDDQIVRLTLT